MMDEREPDAEHRRAQAAQWFARLKTVPVSRRTLEDFFDWRRDPANAEAFTQAESLWNETGRISDRPAILRLTEEAYALGGAPDRQRRSLRPVLGLAMAVVFAILVASWWISRSDQEQDFATVIGEQKALALSDGSQVRLDTQTRLNARMKRASRHIRLEQGRAMFDVAHDHDRPFRVEAGNVEVEATGTKFDVRFVNGVTHVALFEGGVDIKVNGREAVHLGPGQMWSSEPARAKKIMAMDARRASAWTQGRVIFDATPLSEAIAEINRYTPNKLVLAARGRSDERISGSFTTGDPSGFLKAVSAMLSLEIERQPDGQVLLRDPASS